MTDYVENNWVLRLLINLLGYATLILPGAALVYLVTHKNILNVKGQNRSLAACALRLFVYGSWEPDRVSLELGGGSSSGSAPSAPSTKHSSKYTYSSTLSKTFAIGYCFVGLQLSYLTWGVLQEKIMTQQYYSSAFDVAESFRDSQFLVFVNRVLAFAFSGVFLLVNRSQPRHTAPLYKYSYCSFSNILSSWFQYEALKYISFPTQVLAKASKVIPVMIMGWIVSRKSYKSHEYATAVLISVGMSMFLLSRPDGVKVGHSATAQVDSPFAGAVILTGYMVLDSFTSNWQSELFKQHQMSPIQMMCGVNLFSTLLTFASLLQQGALTASVSFMFRHHSFLYDCVVLSFCSAIGQLFVFHTISRFGPVTFVIMMTIRQAIAILLSCIIYQHPMTLAGACGTMIIFVAIFLRIWLSNRVKRISITKPTSQLLNGTHKNGSVSAQDSATVLLLPAVDNETTGNR